jgi:GNAT superfamily N-acetyltransferase
MNGSLRARLRAVGDASSVLVQIIRAGHLRAPLRLLRTRLSSETVSLGLRLETSNRAEPPAGALAMRVRPLEPRDVPTFTDFGRPGLTNESLVPRIRAARLFRSGIRTCYVAEVAGAVAYMQYLIDASQNGKLKTFFGDAYPELAPDEGLLESAFSLERYRGRGLLLHVVPELAKEAEKMGIRRLIAFVAIDNAPMLRGCRACGFVPFVRRTERYRLFRNHVSFEELPAGSPYPAELDSAPRSRA